MLQWMLPRPTDIMSLRLDNTERQTVELADIILSSTRYMASWLRQRSWVLPQNRQAHLEPTACVWAMHNTNAPTLLDPSTALCCAVSCASPGVWALLKPLVQ